jgi:hypothetical protein
MRQISTKGGTRWRCIQSIKAIKKTAAEKDAYGKQISAQNAEAWSAKLKSETSKVPLYPLRNIKARKHSGIFSCPKFLNLNLKPLDFGITQFLVYCVYQQMSLFLITMKPSVGLAMKFVRLILFLILLPISSWWVNADSDPRFVQLVAAVNQLQLEQQSLYQQFLMTQELRRNAFQDIAPTITEGYSALGLDGSRSLSYDENVRLQRERVERLKRYDNDLSQVYSRFLELGDQKKALLDQIIELTQSPPP